MQTSFVKRDRPFGEKNKEKDFVRKELARVRTTAIKSSFGTQKQHYELRRSRPGRSGLNPVYLLRPPHGKRGAVGGQDRTNGVFGGYLTRKHADNADFFAAELYPRHEKQTKKSRRNDRNQI